MWLNFKCKVCNIEFADCDIEEQEKEYLANNIEQDEYGQYLITCNDCN